MHLVLMLSCDSAVLGEQAGCRDIKSQEHQVTVKPNSAFVVECGDPRAEV